MSTDARTCDARLHDARACACGVRMHEALRRRDTVRTCALRAHARGAAAKGRRARMRATCVYARRRRCD
eukprot:2533226-Pleurochrysis_carterae.AAC.1